MEIADYYRWFVQGFSLLVVPLTQLLKKNININWNGKCEKCLGTIKRSLLQLLF